MVNWNELQQLRFRRDQLRGDIHRNEEAVRLVDINAIDRSMIAETIQAEQRLMEAYDMRIKRMERLSRLEAEGEQAQDA